MVVPAFNEEKQIANCLQSILSQIDPADEVIVIDNNSTDKTAEIAEKLNIKVIKEPKQGMIPARNRGFNEASGDIIARTDADTIVPPDWTIRIKEHFTIDLELLGLSGPVGFYDGPDFIQQKIWPSKIVVQNAVSSVMKHDTMIGPNMALTKKAWDKVKKEVCKNDKQVHEDMDLAIHLAEYGKVFFDDSLIVETSFRRWKKLKSYFEYSYRYFTTIEKHKKIIKKIRAKAISMPKTMRKRAVKTFHAITQGVMENNKY